MKGVCPHTHTRPQGRSALFAQPSTTAFWGDDFTSTEGQGGGDSICTCTDLLIHDETDIHLKRHSYNDALNVRAAALQYSRRVKGTCGLVAMTSASHAEGRQFDPGQV